MKKLWSSEVLEFNLKFKQPETSSKFENWTRIGLGGKTPAQDPGRPGGRPGYPGRPCGRPGGRPGQVLAGLVGF